MWGHFVVLRLWSLVAGYAVLAHAQPLGCPGVSRLLFKLYCARFTLLGQSEGCWGVPKSSGIKFSQFGLVIFWDLKNQTDIGY